jgi:hypothetical protein
MPKFLDRITAQEFSSAASAAIDASVDGDTNARIQIDAGGKVTWGSGAATGDVNLYRDAADALKTDDTLEAAAGLITSTSAGAPTATIADGALAVDTTNDAFYFRSGSSWNQVTGGGGGSITTGDAAPSSPSDGDLWYETDTGRTLVYYADGTSSQWVEVGSASAAAGGATTQVQYNSSGSLAGNANFVYDATNNRVGIGTASPTSRLHVTDSTNITPDGNSVGHIQISGSGYAGCFALDAAGFWMSQNSSSRSLIFATNETERMRISGSGYVGIGTTSPDSDLQITNTGDNARIHINGASSGYTHSDVRLDSSESIRGTGVYAFNSANDKTWFWGNPYAATDTWGVCRQSAVSFTESAAGSGHLLFQIASTGACYNVTGTYGTISDERLKSDITTARQYTADLAKLRVVNYTLTQRADTNEETGEVEITPLEEPSGKLLGLIAQEVEKVFPAMVDTGSDGIKSVKTSVLVPMMLTAIQELTARIETLEAV